MRQTTEKEKFYSCTIERKKFSCCKSCRWSYDQVAHWLQPKSKKNRCWLARWPVQWCAKNVKFIYASQKIITIFMIFIISKRRLFQDVVFCMKKNCNFCLFFFYFKNSVILFLVELFSRNRFWPWNSDTEWDCATRLLRMEWLETLGCFNPLSTNPTKRSNTLKQFIGNLPMNCLSLFGHFVGLVLKGLR